MAESAHFRGIAATDGPTSSMLAVLRPGSWTASGSPSWALAAGEGHDASPGVAGPAPTTPAALHASLAHGTSTESSVGESRATTYSAGSVSERLRTMCVWRGGT